MKIMIKVQIDYLDFANEDMKTQYILKQYDYKKIILNDIIKNSFPL